MGEQCVSVCLPRHWQERLFAASVSTRTVNKGADTGCLHLHRGIEEGGLCIQHTFHLKLDDFKAQDILVILLLIRYTIYFPLLGSPLDFFHTPPTTPSEADLAAMALSSAASSKKTQTPSPAGSTTPSATSSVADWTQKLSSPSEWAVISVDSINYSETKVSDAAASRRKAKLSPGSPASLPSEQSWQEQDSGMEPQAAAERVREEMTLVLISLMDRYRASLGLTPNTDVTTGAVGMSLFRFLKDTLRTLLLTPVGNQKELQYYLQIDNLHKTVTYLKSSDCDLVMWHGFFR